MDNYMYGDVSGVIADVEAPSVERTKAGSNDVVSIPWNEYERLLKDSMELAFLKRKEQLSARSS